MSTSGGGFGPLVGDPSEPVDFTLVFELSILSLLPSTIFLTLAVVRLYVLGDKPPRIGGRIFQTIKLRLGRLRGVSARPRCSMEPLQSGAEPTETCRCGIGARGRVPILSAVVARARPGVAAIRTLWLQGFGAPLKAVATACLAVKAVVLLLESVEKGRFFKGRDREYSPEDWSGFWNRGLCVWLNPLLLKGYRHNLSLEDLYPLRDGLPSKPLEVQFRGGDTSHIMPGRFGLASTLLRSLGWQTMYPALPRLLLLGFVFCQPLLIDAILSYLQAADSSAWPRGADSFLIVAFALVYLGITVCSSFYSYLQLRLQTKARAMLVSAIYRKVTEIPSSSTEQVAVTLMSTDVERLTSGFRSVHDVWAELAQVGIAIWLLQQQLGVGAIGPVVVAIICSLATLGVNRLTMPRQNLWMEALGKRINTTMAMLSSMKGIRMAGLSERSASSVQSLREAEIASANGFRTIMAPCFCIAFTPTFLTPVACFGIYLGIAQRSDSEQSFDVRRAFTSLSLVVLLTQPLSSLFQYVPNFLGAANCLDRIQSFLRTPCFHDPREFTRTFSTGSPSHESEKQSSSIVSPVSEKASPLPLLKGEDKQGANAFVIGNGGFSWDADHPVLKSVDICIPRSRLTLIVGPVASGKTTLCKALIGEVPISSGTVYVDSRGAGIGFCDQTPYLTNATARDNILGYSSVDETWYQRVLNALTLPSDFETLPKGDQTMIGSNGTALSTGQRQRVAVARAIYALPPVIILDDVFSGMDNITKKRIFTQLLGPEGLLRISKTTVVMVAHDEQFLTAADHVITLRPSEPPTSGSPDQITAVQQAKKEDPESSKTDEKKEAPSTEEDEPNAGLDDDSQWPNMSDWTVYKYYARAVGWRNIVLMVFFGVVFAFLYTFPSVWLKWWTADVGQRDNFYIGMYALLQAIGLVFWFLFARHCLTTSVATSGTTLHRRLLSTVMSASMAYLSKKDSGAILNRFSQDMQLIDGELPAALLNPVATAFIAVSQVAIITTASPWLALSYPFLLLAFYGVQKFYLRTSKQLRPLDLELKSPLYTHFLDTLRGISTIRALGWSQEHIERNYQLLDTSQRPLYLLAMVQQWLSLVLSLIVLVVAVTLGALALKLRSTIGFTAVALVNLMSFGQMLRSVVVGWTLMETSISAVCRVKEFEEQTPREEDEAAGTAKPVDSNRPHLGRIECRNLEASYGQVLPLPSAQTMSLKDINLVIEAGEKIGICGRSGSGKSSFLASLFRMLDIRGGSITIDSVDLKTIPLSTVRSRINAIPQDPFFLPGTVRMNADPYHTAPDASIVQALRRVQLWDKIQELGDLDSELKPDSLSQGQKQLFSLARAMLRPRCSIVVLDEVTSRTDSNDGSLDFKTEKLMLEVLQEAFNGCTIIAIAHRLETILGFDRVAVFDDGKVIECDIPKMLLERQDSAFSRFLAAGDG
ncbi:Multidrug resistance-associated protein 1 [Tolypocladium ophioglossoides CBS 100239]|uniref:Multidrug resistance-associated protein 1 n=1 Tax=Tolypocladium ophioglossoides (strain CBS 100239) TaxID=1163406 RepID=A0A0L0NBQ1_TOLOC|nr:Multidrug resistance-associated protein 1 [Tolypocladium ophioglossoides CBS 100239]